MDENTNLHKNPHFSDKSHFLSFVEEQFLNSLYSTRLI